jgi:hypothetical protein
MDDKLQKEYEQLRRNCGLSDKVKNESFSSMNHPSAKGQMVSNIGAGTGAWGNVTDVTGALKPEEALKIAIERVLSSGAPINNISFYDEINWNLSKLNFASKHPLDIKQALFKMIEK